MPLPDVDDLPRTLSTIELSELIEGISRGAIWAAGRDDGGIVVGDELIRPIRVGRALRWPTAPIVRALGLSNNGGASASPEPSAAERQSSAERGSAQPKPGTVHDHREEVERDGTG